MNIGIIGGGQLGLMMGQAALKLGHKIISLDPDKSSPITKISNFHIAKDYNDLHALEELYNISDVITYEFENVDLEMIKKYRDKIPQGFLALYYSKDRLIEKAYARSLGIKTVDFNQLEENVVFKYPCIIKTASGGYDGKGQYIVKSEDDLSNLKLNTDTIYIVEEFINFDYEISVIITRDYSNNISVLPVPINKHVNGILYTSTIDNGIPIEIKSKAIEYATLLINDLDYIGTMAVEFFVKGDQVVFNEFAPRPHNSGHYSIEGCNVSQYKNHILAITKQKIIEPKFIKKTLMVNILGQNINYIINSRSYDNAFLHIYGKKEYRHNRKMGHITIVSENSVNILEKIIKE